MVQWNEKALRRARKIVIGIKNPAYTIHKKIIRERTE